MTPAFRYLLFAHGRLDRALGHQGARIGAEGSLTLALLNLVVLADINMASSCWAGGQPKLFATLDRSRMALSRLEVVREPPISGPHKNTSTTFNAVRPRLGFRRFAYWPRC
ncbi:hypothetical protein CPY51_11010 [Rhizobium tubonense]|uniref:Uncharacterized protein n=1 Tax=Rhizobium tubonense TaxID=484088 RepID=A0A2W4EVU9_9HYPH|nr:hypothetical protein CPY51_11010 [Rhizobium tubonense]